MLEAGPGKGALEVGRQWMVLEGPIFGWPTYCSESVNG